MSISDDQDISREDIRGSEDQGKHVAGFERLWVWRKAHQLMIEIHNICRGIPTYEKFKVGNQIERSSASVADNIAEGYTSYYYNDKIKSFMVSRKEAGESQNHLRSLEAKGYIAKSTANEMIGRYEEVMRGINGYINWVRRKRGGKH